MNPKSGSPKALSFSTECGQRGIIESKNLSSTGIEMRQNRVSRAVNEPYGNKSDL